MSFELNIDGIVGPTHNYSGLSYGNMASQKYQLRTSNPKQAALQGLEKMWFLVNLGLQQAFMPPHERPHIPTLRRLGYNGEDRSIIRKVAQDQPDVLRMVSSASAMWCANAATFSPSADCHDKKIHITPANLCSKFHRSIEPETTGDMLKLMFPDPNYFVHHEPLPSGTIFSDEGSANHTRLCKKQSHAGINLFVYSKYTTRPNLFIPKINPARQSYEASTAIARLHQLKPKHTIFIQQNPEAIDAGVFHNDVISVGHRNCLIYHELAYVNCESVIDEIKKKALEECQIEMNFIKITESDVSLKNAVATYLFNSQLITLPNYQLVLIAPEECNESPAVSAYLNALFHDSSNPIGQIHFYNVHESMKNGGGPACLRLRAVLNQQELDAMNQNFILTESLYNQLKVWIEKYYRDRLHPDDLEDPQLLVDSNAALDELTQILKIGSFYSFQKNAS